MKQVPLIPSDIERELLFAGDGPVNLYIIICRSLKLVREHPSQIYMIAGVMEDVIKDFNEIESEEINHSL